MPDELVAQGWGVLVERFLGDLLDSIWLPHPGDRGPSESGRAGADMCPVLITIPGIG